MKKRMAGKSWWRRWLGLYKKHKKEPILVTSLNDINHPIYYNGRLYTSLSTDIGDIDLNHTGYTGNAKITTTGNFGGYINLNPDLHFNSLWCGTTITEVMVEKPLPLTPIKKINKLKL